MDIGWSVLAKVNNKLKHSTFIGFVSLIVALVMRVKIILTMVGGFLKLKWRRCHVDMTMTKQMKAW